MFSIGISNPKASKNSLIATADSGDLAVSIYVSSVPYFLALFIASSNIGPGLPPVTLLNSEKSGVQPSAIRSAPCLAKSSALTIFVSPSLLNITLDFVVASVSSKSQAVIPLVSPVSLAFAFWCVAFTVSFLVCSASKSVLFLSNRVLVSLSSDRLGALLFSIAIRFCFTSSILSSKTKSLSIAACSCWPVLGSIIIETKGAKPSNTLCISALVRPLELLPSLAFLLVKVSHLLKGKAFGPNNVVILKLPRLLLVPYAMSISSLNILAKFVWSKPFDVSAVEVFPLPPSVHWSTRNSAPLDNALALGFICSPLGMSISTSISLACSSTSALVIGGLFLRPSALALASAYVLSGPCSGWSVFGLRSPASFLIFLLLVYCVLPLLSVYIYVACGPSSTISPLIPVMPLGPLPLLVAISMSLRKPTLCLLSVIVLPTSSKRFKNNLFVALTALISSPRSFSILASLSALDISMAFILLILSNRPVLPWTTVYWAGSNPNSISAPGWAIFLLKASWTRAASLVKFLFGACCGLPLLSLTVLYGFGVPKPLLLPVNPKNSFPNALTSWGDSMSIKAIDPSAVSFLTLSGILPSFIVLVSK